MSTLSRNGDVLLESRTPDAPPSSTPVAASSETPDTPVTGSPDRPPRTRWERPALAGLLLVTAVLYLWDLSASGWANSFYSAAAQAGSKSWTAFLYGASDAAGSITVSYTHLRAHETRHDLVCRLLLEKKKTKKT